jgi:hypothetical protein
MAGSTAMAAMTVPTAAPQSRRRHRPPKLACTAGSGIIAQAVESDQIELRGIEQARPVEAEELVRYQRAKPSTRHPGS